jgi:nucleotide-binding universal stress UspA family protein
MRILIPLDESERDRILLWNFERVIAKVSERTVFVLTVVPALKTVVPHAMAHAEAYMEAVVDGLKARGIDAQGYVRKGNPAQEIVKAAAELEADIIAMGTRGRRGLDRYLLGSVTEAVMGAAHCPVAIINEAVNRIATERAVLNQSAYIAGVMWNRVARGLVTSEAAELEFDRLAGAGLDRDTLLRTFRALQAGGVPAEWLDLEFQFDALRRYLPDELEGKAQIAA